MMLRKYLTHMRRKSLRNLQPVALHPEKTVAISLTGVPSYASAEKQENVICQIACAS